MAVRLPPRLLLLCLVALSPGPASASGGDQDRARLALERGEIRPLDEVLRAVRDKAPGDVVSLDLKRDDGRWIYKLKVLAGSGKRRTVEIDAKSLQIVDDDDD